ncbi:MAG: M14 family metallocarboxypeptidase [Comamonadaceae bacterium]|nr:M14 family metallocarboxypeptidase [Comamonadaceae bacterium]
MRHNPRTSLQRLALAVTTFAACAAPSWAQFDPAKVVVEPEVIARQFPDPAQAYQTPGFAAGRKDFTSHAEVFSFIDELARQSSRVAIETMGRSQEGRAMALVLLTGTRGFNRALPTVMLLGQQHGNEPAGGEAALVLAQTLATQRSSLLEQVNVLIVPRANPDAAEHFRRVTTSGIDVNRDHLLLRTPEALAIASAVQRYQPAVTLDMHEFTVAGRWVDKFGSMMRYDALLQAASVGNLNPTIRSLQDRYLAAARSAIEASGQQVSDYHTTSPDPKNKTVSMGGVNVDTGRNVGGLHNSVSILLETRGVGLGRAHFGRRVQAHVAAAMGVIEEAAKDGASLVRTRREAGVDNAQQACRGDMTLVVRQTPERRTLSFLDAQTGEVREIDVDWRSALQLEKVRERTRPCGYLIGSEQKEAVKQLRLLGVKVQALNTAPSRKLWDVENYVVESESSGQRQDARGAIADDGQGIRQLTVRTEPAKAVPARGSYYVSMSQPQAGLISAALEPDSQNSFAANRIMAVDPAQLRRVTRLPAGFKVDRER